MYMTRVIEVSKATNGFVLECRVPLAPEAKSTAKMDSCCCPSSSCEKQYIAKDAQEVADLIADIMPLLDQEFKTEKEFDNAFEKATMSMDDKKGDM